jgi:hypothetical protein
MGCAFLVRIVSARKHRAYLDDPKIDLSKHIKEIKVLSREIIELLFLSFLN